MSGVWLDEYAQEDGITYVYQITDRGQPPRLHCHPDDQEAGIGVSWELVRIEDDDGKQMYFEDLATLLTIDESEVHAYINAAIGRDVAANEGSRNEPDEMGADYE